MATILMIVVAVIFSILSVLLMIVRASQGKGYSPKNSIQLKEGVNYCVSNESKELFRTAVNNSRHGYRMNCCTCNECKPQQQLGKKTMGAISSLSKVLNK